jgi:hypothetical protein
MVPVAALEEAASRYIGNRDAAILENGAPEEPRRLGRRQRYALRNGLRAITPEKACQQCGLYPSPIHGGWVEVYVGPQGAHFSGVKTCSRIWLCPVCSATIRQARAREIEYGATMQLAMKGGLAFGTLTLPHERKDRLSASYDACRLGYKAVREDRSVRACMKDLGINGTIRSTEVTYGGNGWHPHQHLLWFLRRPLTVQEAGQLQVEMLRAWNGHLGRIGWPPASKRRGCLVLPVALERGGTSVAAYLSKVQDSYGEGSSVSREMARGDLKSGKKKSRTPFEVAAGAVEGSPQDRARWLEYADATKGRRAIEWSRGLKGRLGVLEVDDEQLQEIEQMRGERTASLSPQSYRLVARYGADALLLDLAEDGGATAVYELVTQLQRKAGW